MKKSSVAPFLFKSIRADDDDFWRWQAYTMTISEKTAQQEWHWLSRRPLRIGIKKTYGYRVGGVYEVSNEPQFSAKEKRVLSKANSMSYCDPNQSFYSSVFGLKKRKACLIGISVPRSSVRSKLISKYDAGTVNRPYQFSSEQKAKKNYSLSSGTSLFDTLDELVQANPKKLTEILARYRYEDGACMRIFSDTAQSRLLAQVRALDLKRRLVARDEENKQCSHTTKLKIGPKTVKMTTDFYIENGNVKIKYGPKAHKVPIKFYLKDRYEEVYQPNQQIADFNNGLALTSTKYREKSLAVCIDLINSNFSSEKIKEHEEIILTGQVINELSRLTYHTSLPFYEAVVKIDIVEKLLAKKDYPKLKRLFHCVPPETSATTYRPAINQVLNNTIRYTENERDELLACYIWMLLSGDKLTDINQALSLIADQDKHEDVLYLILSMADQFKANFEQAMLHWLGSREKGLHDLTEGQKKALIILERHSDITETAKDYSLEKKWVY